MYDLNTIRKINAKAASAPAREDERTRHCSHCVSVKDGVKSVVLHSAKHRNTAFISGHTAEQFLVAWQGSNSDIEHDRPVERYYNAVPTGKQRLAA